MKCLRFSNLEILSVGGKSFFMKSTERSMFVCHTEQCKSGNKFTEGKKIEKFEGLVFALQVLC